MNFSRVLGTAVLIASLAIGSQAQAELSPRDQAKFDAVKLSLEQAVSLYKTKKLEELGMLLQEVEVKVGELKSALPPDEFAGLEKRLSAAQRLLKNALDDLPAKPATPAKTTPTPTKTPAKTPTKGTAPAGGGVSFVRDIAPIFVKACTGCHINGARGGLSLRTYNDIMKGSTAGIIFTPGKGDGGALLEQLATSSMPPGPNKLTQMEVAAIVTWINQGAKFDGPDPTAPLPSIVPAGTTPNGNPGMQVARATGNEKVSFMRDIAPVLNETCVRCHAGQQAGGNFEMANFNQLISNRGDSGGSITPGNPKGSVIIQKLRGTATKGGRMPRNREPLSEETIQKFETWVAEGAKFDGDDPAQSIDFALKVIKARKMTHDELAEWRVDMALANWAMSNPSNKPDVVRAPTHTIIGRLPKVQMEEASKMAGAVHDKVAQAFRLPTTQPLLKGKLSIFVFDKRFEYSEHARMVEKRDPPKDIAAHWRFDVVDGYGCVPAPRDGDTAFAGNVAEQFAGAYLESLGKGGVPRWFSVGAARMIAARVEPKSVMVKTWEDAVAPAMSSASKIDQILQARDLDGAGSALSYHLVKFMSAKQNSIRFNQLIDNLKRGTPFNNALQQAYGMDAKKLAAACFGG